MTFTEEQQKKYLADGGSRCPFCDSDNISAMEHPQNEGELCWQPVECKDCGKEWREVFRLAFIELDEVTL